MPLDSTTFAPTLVTDLMAARDYLERNGWCQRVTEDAGRVCTVGAIFAVTGGRMSTAEENYRRDAAFAALEDTLGLPVCISNWNDREERTKADVLALYDKTIQRLSE